MRDWSGIEWALALLATCFVAACVFLIGNHITSHPIGLTMAEAYDTVYVPPHTDTYQTAVTDSKGNVTGYTTNYVNYPAEWHVWWRAEGLTYDQRTMMGFDGIKVGDRRQLMVREGGWTHNRYLWEP